MISRRVLLSWLPAFAGASSVADGSPLFTVSAAQSGKGTRVVSLETFCIAHEDHNARLRAYLFETLLPRMGDIHHGHRLCLDAIIAPHIPQAAFLAVFSSFDEMLEISADLASDPRVREARAELESARVLKEVRSQVLICTPDSLCFPADLKSLTTMVLEIRSFDAPAWHDGLPTSVTNVFHRSGIHPIVNACTAAGEHLPRFTYVIPFESLAVREQAWTRLEIDPEWTDLQRRWTGTHGSPATITGKSIYRLARDPHLG